MRFCVDFGSVNSFSFSAIFHCTPKRMWTKKKKHYNFLEHKRSTHLIRVRGNRKFHLIRVWTEIVKALQRTQRINQAVKIRAVLLCNRYRHSEQTNKNLVFGNRFDGDRCRIVDVVRCAPVNFDLSISCSKWSLRLNACQLEPLFFSLKLRQFERFTLRLLVVWTAGVNTPWLQMNRSTTTTNILV